MSRAVMQQALDALEQNTTDRGQRCTYCGQHHCSIDCEVSAAIEALRTELAKPEPYDQQAMEPCDVCGWKAIIPGEPCLMCEKNAQMLRPEPVPVGYVYWFKGHAEGALNVQNLKPGTPLYTKEQK